MGAVHSRERNSAQLMVTPQTISTIEEFLKAGKYNLLRQLLSGSTREQRRELFRTGDLARCIHDAITRKNTQMLQFLVQHCNVSLEDRDNMGLTPLYNAIDNGWETGALILLRGGADVHDADRGPDALSCFFKPILHLAVRSGSKKLVQELVKRGADIDVKESDGNDLLSAIRFSSPKVKKFVWEKMCESTLRAGESPYDLDNSDMHEFIESVFVFNDVSAAKRLIKRRPSCEQRKMWQLLGAWFATNGDYKHALSCWRKETKRPCWFHGLNVEKETARKSALADIVNVDVGQLLRGSRLSDKKEQGIWIRSLLVLENHVPQLPEFITALYEVGSFLVKNKPASAIRLLSRFIANPQQNDISCLTELLILALQKLRTSSELSCSILLEFMAAASKYLRFLTRACTFSMERSCKTVCDFFPLHNLSCMLCRAVYSLQKAYVKAMDIFCEMEVPATPEQLQSYNSHAKDFVSSIFWIFGWSVFHFLGSPKSLCSPSVIKTLVVCSAEVKGQVRLESFPLHLAANEDGDTPLHLFAQHMSQEDLLDNGVLECFLKHGADLCTRNKWRRSVRDILVERGIQSAGELLPSLQCAAAAAFMRDPQLRGKVDQCGVAAVKHFLLDH